MILSVLDLETRYAVTIAVVFVLVSVLIGIAIGLIVRYIRYFIINDNLYKVLSKEYFSKFQIWSKKIVLTFFIFNVKKTTILSTDFLYPWFVYLRKISNDRCRCLLNRRKLLLLDFIFFKAEIFLFDFFIFFAEKRKKNEK